MKVPLPPREAERLEALRRYQVLDTPPEQALDDITTLAAHICEAPTALISFIDSDRQWFKSRFGWADAESSREVSFCAHAILASDGGELVVTDASQDPRFSDNPYVTANPPLIRFYAGVPLVSPEGHALGTLCVIDRKPRSLTAAQMSALRALRRSVVTELELRRHRAELELVSKALGKVNMDLEGRVRDRTKTLAESEQRYRQLAESSPDAILIHSDERIVFANQAMVELLRARSASQIVGLPSTFMLKREHVSAALERIRGLYAGQALPRAEQIYVRFDGSEVHVEIAAAPVRLGERAAAHVTVRDISERKHAETALRRSLAGLRHAQTMARLGHVITDPDGSFESWSESLPSLVGLDEASLPRNTRDWLKLVHPADREMFRARSIEAARSGRPVSVEYRIEHAGGRWIDIRAEIEPIEGERNAQGRSRWFGTMLDVTAQKAAEERIRRLSRVYAVLSGINAAIVRIRDKDELIREACRVAVEAGNFRMAWVGLLNHGATRVIPAAWAGEVRDFFERAPAEVLDAGTAPKGLAGMAIHARKPLVSGDVLNDPHSLMKPFCREAGINSIAMMPLIVEGEATGVLALYAGEVDFFDHEEMPLLLELAADLAFGLENIEKAKKLDYLAYYDPLTGLANRTFFQQRLEQYLQEAEAEGRKLAVVAIDIERFRIINETFGRRGGDAVLEQLAGRLLATGLKATEVARVVADEFAIVVPDVRTEQDLVRRIGTARQQLVAHPYLVEGKELRVSFRAGIALFPTDAREPDALLRYAEAALKKAKAGGEKYVFYTQQMTERVAEKLELENRMRLAVEKHEFVLHYQPKVRLSDRVITGVEALIRWQNPDLGLVPPGDFVPLLEETGLILDVGTWALERAARDHRAWVEAKLRAPRISVNVSPIQLRQREFVARVAETLLHGVVPGGIDLEITESLIMEDLEENIGKLESLRRAGLAIAVDDFGTGYSSLAYLAKLPVEMLKIDRSFIDAMLTDANAMLLVRTIVSLAHSLNLKVIAEGVETPEQERALAELGCDEMQGYVYSRPLHFEAMLQLLRSTGAAGPP